MAMLNIKTILICIILACTSFAHNEHVPHYDYKSIASIAQYLYPNKTKGMKIKPLIGGFSGDRLYLLEINNKKIVIRIQKSEKSMADRRLEWFCTKTASDMSIGPKLLYASSNLGIIVTEFLEGGPPTAETFAKDSVVVMLAKNIKQINNGPIFPREWNAFDYIKARMPKNPDKKIKSALKKLMKIKQILQAANFQKKPCHNDIQPNNLFVGKDRFLFIDWGDAGMSDPFWDLARTSILFGFSAHQEKIFLTAYLGKVSKLDQSRFFIMKQVFFLSIAMTLREASRNPDPQVLKCILRAFAVNNHALPREDTLATMADISNHALKVFLEKHEKQTFRQAINAIKRVNANTE